MRVMSLAAIERVATLAGQVERANASRLKPVVFIHGLWLLPSSWDRWAVLEPAHDAGDVIRNLPDGFAGENLGMRSRLGDGRRVVWPARRDCVEARFFEQRRPPLPAAREQPQAVNEYHRLAS